MELTLSWRRSISYRNQPIDFLRKSVDWFLYYIGLRHERVNHDKAGLFEDSFFWEIGGQFGSLFIFQEELIQNYNFMQLLNDLFKVSRLKVKNGYIICHMRTSLAFL